MNQNTTHPGIAEVVTKSLILKSSGFHQPSEISWEAFELSKHLSLVHQWVQMPYAKTFWQMDHLSLDELHDHYHQILHSSKCTSLIGYYNGTAICQVELYDCSHDEIGLHYAVKPGDIGLHFLMAPLTENKIHGISLSVMRSILSLLLTSEDINRVMGEPDVRNEKANTLVRKAGFRLLQQITMSYKQANLYECTRDTLVK